MRWRTRPAEYNFQVVYKKVYRDVHADALSRLCTFAETTANNWDKIPSLAVSEHISKHTKMSHVAKAATPRKLRYKHTCKNTQLQRKDDATGDSTCVDDMTSVKKIRNTSGSYARRTLVWAYLGQRIGLCAVPRCLLRRYTPQL